MAELEVANKNQISAKTSKKFSSRGKTSLTGQIRTVLRLLAKIFYSYASGYRAKVFLVAEPIT